MAIDIVGWLLPLLVVGCIIIAAPLLGLGAPDFSLVRGINYISKSVGVVPTHIPSHPWLLLCVLPVNAIFATPLLFGEEFGWRGYLQLRLFPDRPLLSAVVTGVIWVFGTTLSYFAATISPTIGSRAWRSSPSGQYLFQSFLAGCSRKPGASGHRASRTLPRTPSEAHSLYCYSAAAKAPLFRMRHSRRGALRCPKRVDRRNRQLKPANAATEVQ